MTTMYRNRRPSRTRRNLLFVLALAVLLGVGGYFLRTPLSLGANGALRVVWGGSDRGASALFGIPHYFRDRAALVNENAALKEDMLKIQAALLDRNLLYEENVALKERLGRSAQPNSLLAAAVMRPPEVPYDTLVLDVGSRDGVSVGDRVAASGSLLIGTIEEVSTKTSRVKLYSSPGTSHQGLLRGTEPIQIEGEGGGSLRAMVPYQAQVEIGDIVTLPGLEANLAFLVEAVERGEGDSAAIVHLRLPVNYFGLRFVEVWRQSN